MSKYFLLFSQRIVEYSAYRFNVLFNIIQSFITPGLLLLVLSRAQSDQISVSSLIPYYLLVSLLLPLVNTNIESEIEELTTSGEINNFLIKPLSLYRFLLFRELGSKFINLLLISLPVILSLIVFKSASVFSFTNPVLILALVSLILAFFMSFNFSYWIGLFCFWIDEFWAIHNLKYVVFFLLGGAVLPYSFFPNQIVVLLKFTPFPYLLNWPVRILYGDRSWSEIIIAIIWLFIFSLGIRLTQARAILKYSHTAG